MLNCPDRLIFFSKFGPTLMLFQISNVQIFTCSSLHINMMSGDGGNTPLLSHHGSSLTGHVNDKNDVLTSIMERILPNGAKAWHLVLHAYGVW